MTNLAERLDRLAGEATAGLEPAMPRRPSGRRIGMVPIVAGLAVAGALVAVLLLEPWDTGPDHETVTAEAGSSEPAILMRPRTDADVIPDAVLPISGSDAELDVEKSRLGLHRDDLSVYVIPSVDESEYCLVTNVADQQNTASTCGSVHELESVGVIWLSQGSPGRTIFSGVVAPDVVGVEVRGEPVPLHDGVFAVDSGNADSLTLITADGARLSPSEQVSAVSEACSALSALAPEPAPAEIEAFVAAARRSRLGALEAAAATLSSASPRTDDALLAAGQVCEDLGVAGYAVFYVDGELATAPSDPLDTFGEPRALLPSRAELAIPPSGPGLSAITRVGRIPDTDITVFTWTTGPAGRPQELCIEAGSTACTSPAPEAPTGLISEPIPGADAYVHAWSVPEAGSVVVLSAGGSRIAQRPTAGIAAFAVPEDRVEIAVYDASGELIGGSTPHPALDVCNAQNPGDETARVWAVYLTTAAALVEQGSTQFAELSPDSPITLCWFEGENFPAPGGPPPGPGEDPRPPYRYFQLGLDEAARPYPMRAWYDAPERADRAPDDAEAVLDPG